MPFNRLQITEDYRKELNKLEEIKNNQHEDLIISVELVLYCAIQLNIQAPTEELWSLLTGYNFPIMPKFTDLTVIGHLRVLVPEFRSKQVWVSKLKEYKNIHEKYRLYTFDHTGNLIPNTNLKYITNREGLYSTLVMKPLTAHVNKADFLKKGEFEYNRTINGDKYSFNGIINDDIKVSRLSRYRKKNQLSFSLPLDLNDTAIIMNKLNPEGNYIERLKNINLISLHQSEREIFKFEDTQHIAGGLSAGKSTWMVMEAYRQIKHNGARVGFVEGSVNQVLSRVLEFRKLGIKAVPLIGKGQRQQHEKRFLSYLPPGLEGFDEDQQYLKSLSDTCTIKALANDYERNNYYPCKALKQGNIQKKLCPLAHTCGIYHEWTDLSNADVWVTTPAALLMSKIPPVIDQYERTLYEAMYDLLDIIFIDEVDIVQKQFDEKYCVEIGAFGQSRMFFEKILEDNGRLLTGKYNQYAGNSLIQNWQNHVGELNKGIWRLFGKLKKSPSIKLKLKEQIVFQKTVASWIVTKSKVNIMQQLQSITESNSDLSDYFRKFWSSLDNNERDDILEQAYNFLFEGQMIDNEEEVKSLLEFYFSISKVDFHLKYLLQFYPAVQNVLGTEYSASYLLALKKDLLPFMKDAMTGSFMGYRYSETEGGIGKFKIVEYSGVGRLLLSEWSHLFENVTGNQGPSVILLSGTSYSPGSSHYHIEGKPNWALLSNQPKSVITQQFIGLYDEKKELIKVSGSGFSKRPTNLAKLIRAGKNHLLQELAKLKEEKRRMLLVVNSYEDVRVAGKTLGSMREFQGLYRILENTIDPYDSDTGYSRFEVEQFRKTDEMILIVPLLAISRGYNILDEEHGALFGSCIFLVRPYPIPNDMSYIIQTLHSFLPIYLNEIDSNGKRFEEAIRHLRHLSIKKLEMMYQTPNFWKHLNEKERNSLAMFIFVPVWQMIGRMLRGGRNARIYYMDGSFHNPDNRVPSLLDYWKEYFTSNKHDQLFQELYGPFIKSIKTINV
jgi:hypothetical protein